MNIFRLAGDFLHLISILLLVWKLKKSKSCSGVSCRMQEIYLIVFLSRYTDLFWYFISVYNTTMKVIFIASTAYLIFLMRFQPPISQTCNKDKDTFPYIPYLVLPALFISLVCPPQYTAGQILWAFSIWLESVAIIPQLLLLQRQCEVENLTSHYVASMGLYRAFYIINWVYRFKYEGHISKTAWIAGAIQVALYLDFFYYYTISRWSGGKLILPYAHNIC